MELSAGLRGFFFILVYVSICTAAPGLARAGSLEAAALQLGTQQAQAQYPAAALQGARAASRSAASCLVTAVQYTHGQQIWRADPCEFCLCLDGEMFCWWQECPPTAPGPCPGPQPFSLCGNSSGTLVKRPNTPYKRVKKLPKKASEIKKIKPALSKTNSKPLVTTAQDVTPSYFASSNIIPHATDYTSKEEKVESTKMPKEISSLRTEPSKNNKQISKFDSQTYLTSVEYSTNFTEDNSEMRNGADSQTPTALFEVEGKTKEGNWAMSSGGDASLSFKIGVGDGETTVSSDASKSACVVMGVEYRVGQSLPSTGSCLACRCEQERPGAPRVACAPRGCAPLDTAPLDDTGAF